MDNNQKSIVQHMELSSVLCAGLDGRELWGRTVTCMEAFLHYSPETNTTLSIGYNPIQIASGVKKKKKRSTFSV